jgi:hypothetical protein
MRACLFKFSRHTLTPTHTGTSLVWVRGSKYLTPPGAEEDDKTILMDQSAPARFERFFSFSIKLAGWKSFERESGPEASRLFRARYYAHIIPHMQQLFFDNLNAAPGNKLQWPTIIQHYTHLTQWCRMQFKANGTRALEVETAVDKIMEYCWSWKTHPRGDNPDIPWPTALPGLPVFKPSPEFSSLENVKPKNRRMAAGKEATPGEMPPYDQPLPFDELPPAAPWWIRVAFMRVPTGVRETTMYFCPRFSELADIKLAKSDEGNYVDFERKMLVVRNFKNAHRSDRPPREIPLTDQITRMFHDMSVRPTAYSPVPYSTGVTLDRWLRPALEKTFGTNKFTITNNALRSWAFNDAWRQISALPDLKPHELMLFEKNIKMYHDHTLATAIVSYSRRVPKEDMAKITKRIDEAYKGGGLAPEVAEFTKNLLNDLQVYSFDDREPIEPKYERHSEHFQVPNRATVVRMEDEEPQPANEELVKLTETLKRELEELKAQVKQMSTPAKATAPTQEGPSPSLPASPHLDGPLDVYLDPVVEQEVKEMGAPAGKRDKLKAKRKLAVEEQDEEIDEEPQPLQQPRRTPRMMCATEVTMRKLTGKRLVETLRANAKTRRAAKKG